MQTERCKPTCKPELNLHDLGSGPQLCGIPCTACGGQGVPHYGFAYPCPRTGSGAHVFSKLDYAREAHGQMSTDGKGIHELMDELKAALDEHARLVQPFPYPNSNPVIQETDTRNGMPDEPEEGE